MVSLDDYPHLSHTQTLMDAIKLLDTSMLNVRGRQSLPRSLLVFDDKRQLMGMVRRRDILRSLEPDFLIQKPLDYRKKLFDVEIDPDLSEFSYDQVIKGAGENAKRPISEIVKPIEVTVNYNDHIFKAIYEMNIYRLNLLPVIKNSDVVGVVRTVDVFHEVATLLYGG